ncbi:hypothetical protein BGZ60DRAFT_511139 [Tricladium varicosporioides]|nr:hypothetical protein BGZ60DRAFT_511139 [Hymenoscyphus varicosporioides]
MSSLKDIMDVDVEPLESQAYRRSREAAQHQASRPSIIQTAETPSPPVEDDEDHSINKGKAPVRRRRSNRVSKSTTISTLPQIEDQQRRDSAVGDVMDFQSGYQGAGASQASSSGMSQQMSRAPDAGAEMPVKYTPVTGRISRAKKGVPVHTCDICRPAKTFTRAEHLRRHQLSHQKPLHACTFEDCERAFHRPDLLARHMHRHETQGEKAYKASDPRSRASSSASESLPSLKTETLVPGSSGMGGLQASPTDSSTPRTTSGESAMTASSSNTITQNFPPINSAGTRNHKRSASVAQLSEGMSYPPPSPGASRTPVSYSQMTSDFSTRTSDFLFAEGGDPSFAGNYTTTPQLPLLRIPEDPFPPALSYAQDNSPWCSSSASDSTFSNHSDGSRSARQWSQRGRSASIADWPISATSPWTSHGLSTTPQDMRGSPFDAVLDQYEQTTFASPRVSPPNASQSQLLDVPGYGSYYMESVGTPTLSTYTKPISQVFPASPSRVSNAGLASIDATRAKEQLALHAIPTTTSEYLPQPQLETYLDSYFEHFHPLFPIIHRPTFDPTDGSLLSTAVAAIGTQYHNTVEARQKGSELNESCRKNIAMCTSWSLPIMQAILLTELFTRFRGRKTQVTLSRQFENLYRRSQLFQYNEQNQTPTSTTTSPTTSASVDVLLARYGAQTDGTAQPLDLTSKWIHWFQTEARQRLLTACFIFDVHQSLYHQQPRSKVLGGILHPALSYPCAERLWNARTATEWQSLQSEHAYEQRPFNLLDLDLSQQPRLESPFSQTLLICSLTTQFPTRQEPIYSNHFNPRLLDSGLGNLTAHFPTNLLAQTYLALYHTPLLDLLAIAGDTWIFSQKVTPPAKYCDHLRRLKSWSTSPAAAQATIHSCHILSLRLSRPYKDSHQPDFLSDYWSLYVATLICWAFGHRYQISNNVSSGLNRGNSSTPARPAVVEDVTSLETADGARSKALQYVNSMLALNIDDLLTPKASMKGETSSVINAVRYCLELSSVGDKSSILVDCIGVLKKISKSGKGKWF